MEEDISLKSKILTAMGMTEEAEVIALKSQVSDLEAKIDTMQKDFAEALKSMQEEFTQTLTEALKPVDEVVAEKSEDEPEEAEPETTEEEVEVEEEEVVEEEPEEEPVAEKGESKAEPVHDNITAEKAKPTNIYDALGRNPDGTRKL